MVETQHPTSRDGTAYRNDNEATGWVGWVLFGGIIMITVGFFNILEGVIALSQDDLYLVNSNGLFVHVDYSAWGWALLIWGLLLGLTGLGVIAGQTWARVVGVILAVGNAVLNMVFMPAYPIWMVLTIALDVIVIYALVAHGRETRAVRS